MRLEDIKIRDQRALALIADIALLLDEAKSSHASALGSACARSSITNSSLLLECVSNSCLFSLGLPGKLLDELDKLPALSKLDYFLFATTGRHIDRGCREAELASEVLKLRDHVVHPKPKPGTLITGDDIFYVDYGKMKSLGVPLDVREWDFHAAQQASSAVSDFLRKYFVEWCGLSKGRVTTLLIVREKAAIQSDIESWLPLPFRELEAIRKWLPTVSEFLDLRSQPSAA